MRLHAFQMLEVVENEVSFVLQELRPQVLDQGVLEELSPLSVGVLSKDLLKQDV